MPLVIGDCNTRKQNKKSVKIEWDIKKYKTEWNRMWRKLRHFFWKKYHKIVVAATFQTFRTNYQTSSHLILVWSRSWCGFRSRSEEIQGHWSLCFFIVVIINGSFGRGLNGSFGRGLQIKQHRIDKKQKKHNKNNDKNKSWQTVKCE